MPGKKSAFGVLRSKTKRMRKRVRGSLNGRESQPETKVRTMKRAGDRKATPYQLMNLTRSPKVYMPTTSVSNSSSPTSFSSCILPRENSQIEEDCFEETLQVKKDDCKVKSNRDEIGKKISPKKQARLRRKSLQTTISSNNKEPMETTSTNPGFMFDSRYEGEKCFEWLIAPTKPEKFFRDLWERRPLVVKRHNPNYYKGLFSMAHLDHILKTKDVWFGKNIDLTSYTNGVRETHNPPGRAYSSVVWDRYQNGCSVRMLNPQTFSTCVWKLNSILQEFFGSFVGANVYLTPPGTQGFAPHYDDIEAFVIQLDGSKRWRLYAPRNPQELLPRYSSENFKEEDIGEPILDVLLQTGDLLYFPRGIIHQAVSPSDTHSLHITLSTCQKNTWGDYLELLVPRALQMAMEEDVEFRQSLPRKFLSHLGVSNSDFETDERSEYLNIVQKLMTRLVEFAPVDAAADQLAKRNLHEFLPPLLTKYEEQHSIHGYGNKTLDGSTTEAFELEPDSKVKLLRAGILRLVMESNVVRVYYYHENSREYHKEGEQYVEINPELAPAVEQLCHSYPDWVTVENLPLETLESQIEIATILFERGLIVVENVESDGLSS